MGRAQRRGSRKRVGQRRNVSACSRRCQRRSPPRSLRAGPLASTSLLRISCAAARGRHVSRKRADAVPKREASRLVLGAVQPRALADAESAFDVGEARLAGARSRGGRRRSRPPALANTYAKPAAARDVAGHEPMARPRANRGLARRSVTESTGAPAAQAGAAAGVAVPVRRVAAAGAPDVGAARRANGAIVRRETPGSRFRGGGLVRRASRVARCCGSRAYSAPADQSRDHAEEDAGIDGRRARWTSARRPIARSRGKRWRRRDFAYAKPGRVARCRGSRTAARPRANRASARGKATGSNAPAARPRAAVGNRGFGSVCASRRRLPAPRARFTSARRGGLMRDYAEDDTRCRGSRAYSAPTGQSHGQRDGSACAPAARPSAADGRRGSVRRVQARRFVVSSARLTWARRGGPARERVAEGVGGEIPRWRTRMRSPAASPGVAAREPTARPPAHRATARRKAWEPTAAPAARPSFAVSVRRVPAAGPSRAERAFGVGAARRAIARARGGRRQGRDPAPTDSCEKPGRRAR